MTKTISLHEFYSIIQSTLPARRHLTRNILSASEPRQENLDTLKAAYYKLDSIPEENGKRMLTVNSRKISTDLGYETEELKRDILFIEKGEGALYEYLSDCHHNFTSQVENGLEFLKGRNVRTFITDRDGTVNNYCGRYLSSIQSVYNSVFISRFSHRTAESVILTAAPLDDVGIVDISVNPEGLFTYAGSKGREYLTKKGERLSFPIESDKQSALDKLNAELNKLVSTEGYEIFSYIGSGFQPKFGQTTLARQDIYSSVDNEKSLTLLKKVQEIISKLDPSGNIFRIEDTGKDIEIILTIEVEGTSAKDYDKGDGVSYLDKEIPLNLEKGTPLICGDTRSDLPMVEAAMKKNNQTRAIFVTEDRNLTDTLESLCSNSITVSSPDVLITILDKFSKG
ncbi:Trehalose-6-phosphate synthase [Chitinispirillum alkaliphilum]|nr:Trehalose-6-phosphate synthase [Chitinispirillum alkaliphilum]